MSLPTEQQWQRAAQGDTDWHYPWGDQFDSERCSCNRKTTLPVAHFPDGASAYGVMDMSGNVWEWCVDNWQTGANDLSGKDIRSLRGGSYYDETHLLTASHRTGGYPQDRNFFRGFRLIAQG
jgi:formylglycine-generating enzyme required for sulfatase activity